MQAFAKALPAAALSDTVRSVLSTQAFPTGQLAVLVAWAVARPARRRPLVPLGGVSGSGGSARQIGRMLRPASRSSIAGCERVRAGLAVDAAAHDAVRVDEDRLRASRARRSARATGPLGSSSSAGNVTCSRCDERARCPTGDPGSSRRRPRSRPASSRCELLEHRQLLLARMAPRREERDHHRWPRSAESVTVAPVVLVSVKSGAGVPTSRLAGVGRRHVGRRRRRRRRRRSLRLVRDDQRERRRPGSPATTSTSATIAARDGCRLPSSPGALADERRRRQRRRTPASGRRSTSRRTGSRPAASGSRISANARATKSTPSTSTDTA